ncbi:MAG TPA: nuclear transport factor 2 family protein [Stellaceae bacterium]|nr:nuclear transport factor 2 family protein [Stellaceae bacterium]
MTRLLTAAALLTALLAPIHAREAVAAGPADDLAVRNHITCYPFGIDAIGRGDFDAGIAIWKQCFADDYRFTVNVGRGATVCPGDACPFPKTMSSVEMRANFARQAFQASGFTKTSHHITNAHIVVKDATHATVNAYIQAWHLKPDGSILAAPGIWDLGLEKKHGAWRIETETLTIVFAGILQSPAPPAAAK